MAYILAIGDTHIAKLVGNGPYRPRGRPLRSEQRSPGRPREAVLEALEETIEQEGEPEALFVVGDLVEGSKDTESFYGAIASIQRSFPGPILVVPGNHDPRERPIGPLARGIPPKVASVILRDEIRQVEIGGESLRVLGLDYVRGRERRPVEALKALRERLVTQLDGIETVDILLTHLPPFKGISDGSRGERAIGSQFVDDVIHWLKPGRVIYAHQHELAGDIQKRDGCTFQNVCAQRVRKVFRDTSTPQFWRIDL